MKSYLYADLNTRGLYKNDPLTTHFLLRALADAGNENTRVDEPVDIIAIRNAKGKYARRVSNISIEYNGKKYTLTGTKQKKGGELVFTTKENVEIDYDQMPRFINCYRTRLKMIEEYSLASEIKIVGKYKDCQGGGWYTTVDVYEFRNRFYARLDCSDTMRAVYCEQCNL